MRKVTRPTRLAEANWHIAETRKCIAQQKALIKAMKREKRDVSGSRELLALTEEMLRLMLARPQVYLLGTQRLLTKSTLRMRAPRRTGRGTSHFSIGRDCSAFRGRSTAEPSLAQSHFTPLTDYLQPDINR